MNEREFEAMAAWLRQRWLCRKLSFREGGGGESDVRELSLLTEGQAEARGETVMFFCGEVFIMI